MLTLPYVWKKLLKVLQEPIVILVRGDEVRPTETQATVGQTVFWAVERSSGIAITDARLVKERT